MKSKNKIEFFRYYRPIDTDTGYARSDMGVCFYIRMNYKEDKRWMRVSASVCNGDNFNKEKAKDYAKLRYDCRDFLEFSLADFECSHESIIEYMQVELVTMNNHDGKIWQAVRKQLKMKGI